jgi:dienelactone hydrolase
MVSVLDRLVNRVRKIVPRRRFRSFENHRVRAAGIPEYSPSWVHGQVSRELKPKYSFDPENSEHWRKRGKAKLHELLSIPANSDPLVVERIWSASDTEGDYQKLELLGEYGSKIPIYVCIPHPREAVLGTVICLQGHTSGMHNSIGVSANGENVAVDPPPGRNLVKWCFDNQFAALCLEQRCFGERAERAQTKKSSHPCEDTAMHAILFGRTLMGERLADIELCLRYISENAGLDKPIGIMGNSLGGTVSIYSWSLLDQIDFAIVGSCVSTLDDSIGRIHHCTDLYIPRLREFFEFSDIIGLGTPKPLVVVQGDSDPIFPYYSLQKVENEVKKIYELEDADKNFIVKSARGGHRFYPDLASEGFAQVRKTIINV